MYVWQTWLRLASYIHNTTAAQGPTEMRGGHPDGQAGPAEEQAGEEEPLHFCVPCHWLAKSDFDDCSDE